MRQHTQSSPTGLTAYLVKRRESGGELSPKDTTDVIALREGAVGEGDSERANEGGLKLEMEEAEDGNGALPGDRADGSGEGVSETP